MNHLGIDRFVVVGMSTGGAYALASASHTSRVIAVVACGAISDMRWPEGKAMNVENIGRLSILTEVVETTRELLARCTVTR